MRCKRPQYTPLTNCVHIEITSSVTLRDESMTTPRLPEWLARWIIGSLICISWWLRYSAELDKVKCNSSVFLSFKTNILATHYDLISFMQSSQLLIAYGHDSSPILCIQCNDRNPNPHPADQTPVLDTARPWHCHKLQLDELTTFSGKADKLPVLILISIIYQ